VGLRLAGWPFVVGTGIAASLPVLAATVRALADGWMPMGDQGIIATRAYDVLTAHMPLLGQYSEASTVTGQPTYSPGPMLYWLLAVPAHLGRSAALTVTMALVNVVCVVGAVALAARRGGPALAALTGAAIALMCVSLSAESLHGIFNPSAALFPFLLLFPLCWSLACGDYRLLPLTVLVASFTVQCHVAYLPPVAGLLVVGGVGLVLARRRRAVGRMRPWLLAALAVAALCWSAPVVQQLSQHPGNLGVLANEATAHQPSQGPTRAARALERAIGVPPRWLRKPDVNVGRLSGVSGGDYGDTRLQDLWTVPSTLTAASAALVIGALAVLALVAWRRRRGDLTAAAVLALALCVALAALVAKTPIKATNTLGYMLWWGSVAGTWVWVTLIWSLAVLIASRVSLAPLRAAVAPAGALLVLVAGVSVAAAQTPDTHTPYYRPTSALATGLDRALQPGTSVKLAQQGGAAVAIEPTIRYTLRRHGVRALGYYAARRPGAWYELDGRSFRYVVSVNADRPPHYAPARVVARARLTDSRGPHRLTATLSPPGATASEGCGRSPTRPATRTCRAHRKRQATHARVPSA
jgi:hypothetical protein